MLLILSPTSLLRQYLTLAGFLTASTSIAAEEPYLVKDINASVPIARRGSIYPYTCVVGGTVFFPEDDGFIGGELWKSDGTPEGTVLVKDIVPGVIGSNPFRLTNLNGTLFFMADDGIHGTELWKSDGTAAGTMLLRDSVPGPASFVVDEMLAVNGILYFSAGTESGDDFRLWRSDGTDAGTKLVKAGSEDVEYYPEELTDMNGTLFFRAGSIDGWGLWRSDGTDEGTVVVKDIDQTGSFYPTLLTNVNGTLFFCASDGLHGLELWKSDGTEGGTVMVRDINPGTGNSAPAYLTNVDGTLYFQAFNEPIGWELWRSDGTNAGTMLVKDIYRAYKDSFRPDWETCEFNGRFFFSGDDGVSGSELWTSDGTAEGTQLFKEFSEGADSSSPRWMTVVGDRLFFNAYDADASEFGITRLWSTDGTVGGTTPLHEGWTSGLTALSGKLFFTNHGNEYWTSDGTTTGTILLKDVSPPTTPSNPESLTDVSGTLLFAADDGINGKELWKSDGTALGTRLVRDIHPAGNSSPASLVRLGGAVFFTANDGSSGLELWRSDGTTTGTSLVKDIFPGITSSSPQHLTVMASTLFFSAEAPGIGRELWKSDGTAEGTIQVVDLGNANFSSSELASVGGLLFFTLNGNLWKSHGSAAGTVVVKDVTPSSNNISPSGLTDVDGMLFFIASDPTRPRRALWKSDGTAAGTVPVRTFERYWDAFFEHPRFLTNVRGTLYLTAYDEASGVELWKSDGTTAGTVVVKDIAPGLANSIPESLVEVGGTLYLTAVRNGGAELWKTDGTEAGSVLLKRFLPWSDYNTKGRRPLWLANVNGVLYFAADDGVNGMELWKSDGTPAGTVLVGDAVPGGYALEPTNLTSVGRTLFFSGLYPFGDQGRELWGVDVRRAVAGDRWELLAE